jgi:hypothetical protein
MAQKTITQIGQLSKLSDDWYAHMRAANYAPRTITTYRLSREQLDAFLTETGMPTDAAQHHPRTHRRLHRASPRGGPQAASPT